MVKIGKILKRKGFDNEIIIALDIQEDTDISLSKLPFLFVELQEGSKIPYRLLEIKPWTKNQFLVQFDRVEEELAIQLIMGKNLWLPKKKSQSLITSDWFDHPIIGYEVWNNNDKVGEIVDIYIVDPQTLLAVNNIDNDEILIPLVEEWIKNVDAEKGIILMTLPEGLLSV